MKLQLIAMNIVNQLFDLAEVPVKKRQEINDTCDEFVKKVINEDILALFNSEGRRVIGQCGSCKKWITRDREYGNCRDAMDGIYTKNYGCWFWEEK